MMLFLQQPGIDRAGGQLLPVFVIRSLLRAHIRIYGNAIFGAVDRFSGEGGGVGAAGARDGERRGHFRGLALVAIHGDFVAGGPEDLERTVRGGLGHGGAGNGQARNGGADESLGGVIGLIASGEGRKGCKEVN